MWCSLTFCFKYLIFSLMHLVNFVYVDEARQAAMELSTRLVLWKLDSKQQLQCGAGAQVSEF